jgi:hypothetical protein
MHFTEHNGENNHHECNNDKATETLTEQVGEFSGERRRLTIDNNCPDDP